MRTWILIVGISLLSTALTSCGKEEKKPETTTDAPKVPVKVVPNINDKADPKDATPSSLPD